MAGALDDRFGFRAPFIFGIIVTALELIGRLLIIERSAAERMDASFTTLVGRNGSSRGLAYGSVEAEKREERPTVTEVTPQTAAEGSAGEVTETPTRVPSRTPTATDAQADAHEDPVHLSIPGLLLKLLKSPRALSAVFLTLSFGYACRARFLRRSETDLLYSIMISSLEPVVPLYLQSVYGLDVSKIGLIYIAAVVPSFICTPLVFFHP